MSATLAFDRAAAEAFLLGRINYERDMSVPYRERNFRLDRMRELLARLGDPHLAAPAVHVAGTKGKGSTCAMIAAILAAAGVRTGLYTSPHFERIEERMSVGGEICPPDEFADLVRVLQPHVEAMDRAAEAAGELSPTYFEVTTALAFLHFARRRVEAMVLEVGLGGRLDSTNVCQPCVTAITSISFDHTQHLGTTLAAIAGEKAGIVKPGVPLVCGVIADEPREAIHAIAAREESPVWQAGRDYTFDYDPSGPRMTYREREAEISGIALGLVGRHQAANAAVAIAAIRRLAEQGWRIGEEPLRAGLAAGACPGRVEVLRRQPTVILDTAHNQASIEALLDTLDESFPARRRTILFACSRDKDHRAMLGPLVRRCDRLILTRFANSTRATELEPLMAAARAAAAEGRGGGTRVAEIELAECSAEAWRLAQHGLAADDLICITGSFFLAAEMRQAAAATN